MMLAALAGAVDALGYIRLHHTVYVSFMSGNTTQLGIALGGGRTVGPSGGWLIALIALFVAGAAMGTVIAARAGRHAGGRYRASVVLAVVSGLLFTAAFWPGNGMPITAVLAMVLAMGILNAALEQVGDVPMGLTYVTGTLVRLGRGVGRMLSGNVPNATPFVQALPWLGLVCGAALGSIVDGRYGRAGLALIALVSAVLAAVMGALPEHWRRQIT